MQFKKGLCNLVQLSYVIVRVFNHFMQSQIPMLCIVSPSNLTYQNFSCFIFIHKVHSKDMQIFYPLLHLTNTNITCYCLFLYDIKIKKWIKQADFYVLIPVWDIPDDNMLSCERDFNRCNALLFHSFHQNTNKMIQTAGM